jgi:probable Rubsico expression protein CbbX
MWGITTKHFKLGVVLLGGTVALALAWQYLSHVLFLVFIPCVAFIVILVVLGRDSFRQADKNDPLPKRMTVNRRQPARPAGVPRRPARPAARPAGVQPRTPGNAAARPRAAAADSRARRRGELLLGPDATVTLSEERQIAGVDDVFAALDRELVGLVPVKKKVEEIASLLLVDRVRLRFGLTAPRPNLHMCFTGEPGTGKTTVALRMADLLYRLGYVQSPHVVHAMRDDLVGEYIGHTAPKTKRVLDKAMGGVLFIDEAYYLYRASDSKDYGQEAIDILLQVMENDRDRLVVILAGYKDRMDEFFGSNPGMSSRIAHHLDFVPYQIEELVAIGRAMLDGSSYYLSSAAETAFREYLALRIQQPRFANARSVRNELERARLRHAQRLASDPERHRTMDDLMRIEPADILASPVFALAAAESAIRR